MINWNEYIQIRKFIKYRCNFCREWFDEKDDCKIHIKENHEVVVEIKTCRECKNPFVPVMEDQVICGRKDCILKEDSTRTSGGAK